MYAPDDVALSTRTEPDLEPRLLRAFLAVAREGHFGRAASTLNLAQSALSRQVQQLERLLGVRLFIRSSRGVVLSSAGQSIVPEVERALSQNRRIAQTAWSAASDRANVVRVSAPLPSPPGGLLAAAVQRFGGTTDANFVVSLLALDDADQVAALADGRIDAILSWHAPRTQQLASYALLEESTTVLLPRQHHSARKTNLSLVEVAREQILFPLRERSHCWAQLSEAAAAANTSLNAVPTAPSAVLDMVAAGLGVSAVPSSFRLIRHPGVVCVPLREVPNRMHVVWRNDDKSAGVPAFIEACQIAARELSAKHVDVWSIVGSTSRKNPQTPSSTQR